METWKGVMTEISDERDMTGHIKNDFFPGWDKTGYALIFIILSDTSATWYKKCSCYMDVSRKCYESYSDCKEREMSIAGMDI